MFSTRTGRARAALRSALLLCACGLVALSLGCLGSDDEGAASAAALADRWLRLGEDYRTNVAVYEGALPPILSSLLNPGSTAETPVEDLVAVPVHPTGTLLGSYMLRRTDGSYLVWLFYDVVEADAATVTSEVAAQVDETPWQVIGEQGNPSYTVIQFQSTRADDVTGTVIIERVLGSESFALVVDRDGGEQTLTVARAARTPLIEADLATDLTVSRVYPGLAQAAGLQADDRLVRVGSTDVTDAESLRTALGSLDGVSGTVAVTYLLEIAPPLTIDEPSYAPRDGLALPSDFPLGGDLADLVVDQYQTFVDPSGDFWAASLLTTESTSVMATRVRDALSAGDWEIVSDEPLGFATVIQFADASGDLVGSVQIDLFAEDEAFTQVLLQIQSGVSGGS
jgi:hypothetical protein